MSSLEIVTIGLLRELASGDAIVRFAAEPALAAFGDEDDAILEARMFLAEHLATAEPEVVARYALPRGSTLEHTRVLVPRDDLPRRWNVSDPIRFTSLVIPTLPNTKGVRDRWVVVLALQHTFFVRADEDLHAAVTSEVKRIVAARELDPAAYLDLFPPRDERIVELVAEVSRAGARQLVAGVNRQRRLAELEAKRAAIAVLDSVADPLHAGVPLGRVKPQPYPLRDAELAQLRTLLGGEERASALVLGKERVGKSGLVRAWLEREHEENRPRLLYATSGARLVAGMSGLGQWQERVRRVMEAAALVDAVLYFDDLADLFADRPGGHVDIPTAMRPWLEDARVRVLGELREEIFDRVESHNGGFFACFGRVRLEPLDGRQARAILDQLSAAQLARDPDRPVLTGEGNRALVELAERYLPYESFPGKAVRLAREVTAAVEIALGSEATGARIGPDRVHETFSVRTGVPTFLLRDESALRVEDVIAALGERLVGQDEAVRHVAELVCVVKAGLQPAGKPLATLLFVGPTGVGKTELARALAALLFGSDERLVRFDMSEYASAYATERLFRGSDGGEGLLTRKVREQPFSVVLLDEIEKAHPAAFDLLLQVTGEGRLTDGRGKTAYFHNTILIMTSNLGATHRRAATGFAGDASRPTDEAHYAKVVRETFRPEMVNRIDRIVAFRSLGADDFAAVARIATARAARRRGVSARAIDLAVSDAAVARLAADGMSDVYGARALRRHVERAFVTPLARLLSSSPELDGASIKVDVDPDEGVTFAPRPGPARRSGNAAHALAQITDTRRRLHRHTRRDRIEQLREQAAYLVAQLGYFDTAKKRRKRDDGPDGAELGQMAAEHARYAELLGALDRALAEVFAIEELALAAFVAGEPVEPLVAALAEPERQRPAALVRALVAEERDRDAVTVMVKELDDRRAFDLWLLPLLRDAERRGWRCAVHLDADTDRAGRDWPDERRWGPPRAVAEALPPLEDPERTFRNVILSVEGDHARMWLGLESGTHSFRELGGPHGADARLHVSIVAARASLTTLEWTPPTLDPPNAQVAEGLAKGTLVRIAEGRETISVCGTWEVSVPLADYWRRFEEIALAHLLGFESGGLQDRDALFRPMIDDRFAEVRALARAGRKIEAIKLFRQLTGIGLKEAKDAVEAMA